MTTYVYKAKKRNAETVTGHISAQNQEEAVDLINQLGLLPISIIPQSTEYALLLKKPKKVKTKDIYFFTRQLSNLLKSGLSLLRALILLEDQAQDPYLKRVIGSFIAGIKNGKSFSECLASYPHLFSSLYLAMVLSGEESGNLREMLLNIAVYQKKQAEIVSKVRTSLAYPAFMAVVGVCTIYFILTFVLPRMMGLFENMNSTLPWITVALINVSTILNKGFLWVLIGVLIITFWLVKWKRSEKGKIAISRILLKMPMIGQIVLNVELSRFCRSMVLMMNSGVPLLRTLDISVPILGNDMIKSDLYKCRDALAAGGSFGETLKRSAMIPVMMGHLISIGEESGNLNDVLSEIADTYEQDAEEKIKIMTTLLEPLMILIVGIIVGTIVFAMLLPIFQVDVFA